MSKNPISALSVSPEITLYHRGPALDHGPLPSLFYFALSGPDSLCLDPFNQPVQFLQGMPLRIFSLTLPGHENELPPTQAVQIWAEDFAKGIDSLDLFLNQAEQAVHFTIHQKLADPEKLAIAGLSRGGLIASHLAARLEQVRFLLEFAPITRLSKAKEFAQLKDHPQVNAYDAEHLANKLWNRHVRLYIGNHDTRVGTRECFEFAMSLTAQAHERKIRSPQIELFLTPSIGHMGHGTSPEIFQLGAKWIADCLSPPKAELFS